MNSFPLYTSLSVNLPNKSLTARQKQEFINKTKTMDQEGHELIYALMRVFFLENEGCSPYNILYGGQYTGKNIMFDLDNIPEKLQQLLYKFSKIHVKKMKEDMKIAKTRVD